MIDFILTLTAFAGVFLALKLFTWIYVGKDRK